ncbi:hypothetical protein GCM10008944_01410 [Cytobacillus oceanisediminis]
MTLAYRVEPLTDADSIAGKGHASPFSATWTDTLDVLEREVRALRGRDVVLQLEVLAGQLTKSGQLRARSKAASRAARISFETPDGPMNFETAAFTRLGGVPMTESWQHNVRAIALGLEALRKVDRYGIGQGAQYAGYKALGAGSGAVAMGGMTTEQAYDVLHDAANALPGAFDSDKLLYRTARAASHPDRHGGDQSLWDDVEQAGRVLGLDR